MSNQNANFNSGHATGRRGRLRGNNQWIPGNINNRVELITEGEFLMRSGAFVALPWVLLSKHYDASYIWEDTLVELLHPVIPAICERTMNPRGGLFKPIGLTSLCVSLGSKPFLVDLYVLPGSPNEAGVLFVLGKTDIETHLGSNWTPESHSALIQQGSYNTFALET